MAEVAQLVRALDCGSGGRWFESHLSPKQNTEVLLGFLLILEALYPIALRNKQQVPHYSHTVSICAPSELSRLAIAS